MMQLHILAVGQSNLSNHCGSLQKSESGRAMLEGETHPLHDPIPGGTGTLGSVWPRFAEQLKAQIPDLDLQVTLTARGGTSIEEWAPGGPCFEALEARLEAGDATSVNLVVFQQGEKDTLLETSEADYSARFHKLHAAVTKRLGSLPWIICQSSYRFGVVSPAVVSAQKALASSLPNTYAGPDLDAFGEEFRRDNTHFNDLGLDIFARELVACVTSIETLNEL